MKQAFKYVSAITLCIGLLHGTAQAAAIQSMTIENIYDAPGWISSSSMNGGAFYYFTPFCCSTMFPTIFVSAGSTDGTILMNTQQGNGAFTTTALFDGSIQLNTLNGAPSGSISGDVLTLDLSGFGGQGHDYMGNSIFLNFSPDPFTLSTQVEMIDDAHYYYAANWTHYANSEADRVAGFANYTWAFHIEGIATLAPVPEAEIYSMLFAGLSLIGLVAHRRRKLV